jgi:hypothetical protein
MDSVVPLFYGDMQMLRCCAKGLLLLLVVVGTPAMALQTRPKLDDQDYVVNPWIPSTEDTNPGFDRILVRSVLAEFCLDQNSYKELSKLTLEGTKSEFCQKVKDAATAKGIEIRAFNLLSGLDAAHLVAPVQPYSAPDQPGGPDVIGAIAGFLAERFRLEMRAWLIDSVVNAICIPPAQPELTFFPRVCRLSANEGSGILLTEATVMHALRNDLTEVPAYLIWRTSGGKDRWGYVLTSMAIQVENGDSPRAVIAGLAETGFARDECFKQRRCSLYALGVAAQLLEIYAENKIAFQTRAKGLARVALWRMLKGGLHGIESETIDAKAFLDEGEKLAEVLNAAVVDDQTKFQVFLGRLDRLTVQMDGLKAKSDHLRALLATGASGELIQNELLSLLANESRYMEDLTSILRQDGKGMSQDSTALTYVFSRFLAINAAFQASRYSEAVYELREVLRCVRHEGDAMPGCQSIKTPTDVADSTNGVLKHIAMIAAIADAQTTADAQKVLDNWASPVGSWKLKRGHNTASIGALVGLSVADETLEGPGVQPYRGTATSVFAPIGIDLSMSTGGNWTFGVFISVVDFGNLVSARVRGSQDGQVTDTKTNVGFQQIAAPGVFVRWGIGKSPWVLAIGWARTPQLRTAELAGGAQTNLRSDRLMVGLGMDIPFMFF